MVGMLGEKAETKELKNELSRFFEKLNFLLIYAR